MRGNEQEPSLKEKRRCAMKMPPPAPSSEGAVIKYVCGIDIGSQCCVGCICRPDKSVVIKSITFANAREGWQIWEEKLKQLDAPAGEILIGMEATSRYGENLYQELEQRGYVLRLFHPGQTHHFHQQRGLRAKTDRLDAMTIARALLSGEARMGYVPDEQVATYRELVRLHTQLADTAASYQNEIQALVVVLFPEFTQVFADPCLPTALAVLKAFPSAQALVEAGVEALVQVLRAQPAAHYGRPTAKKLVALANQSVSSGRARAGRSTSLRILCDQLEHTQANLARLNTEIEQLLNTDPGVKGLQQVPEFGPKTLAVLRAELGDVQRFSRIDARDCLWGDGYRDQGERSQDRQSQTFQTRQWLAATRPLHERSALHSSERVGLWCLLSAFGATRPQEGLRTDGRDAQNVGSGCPLTHA